MLEVLKNNRATYYNYRTGRPISLRTKNLLEMAVALTLALCFDCLPEKFVEAVITVFAILLGFSFNALFYIISSTKIIPNKTLENKIRTDKAQKLGEELFFNVSYFNLVSLCLIGFCLATFLSESSKKAFSIPSIETLSLEGVVITVCRIFFFLLLIEASQTFVRLVARINRYFSMKIKLASRLETSGR